MIRALWNRVVAVIRDAQQVIGPIDEVSAPVEQFVEPPKSRTLTESMQSALDKLCAQYARAYERKYGRSIRISPDCWATQTELGAAFTGNGRQMQFTVKRQNNIRNVIRQFKYKAIHAIEAMYQ